MNLLNKKNRNINKEKDEESTLGMADYGVRKYDSFTGRFLTADVLFEKYPAWNPYHYTRNHPTIAIDDNGMFEKEFYVTSTAYGIDKAVELQNAAINSIPGAAMETLKATDLNDGMVLGTYGASKIGILDQAYNLDLTPADNTAVACAGVGLLLPVAAGSLINKLADFSGILRTAIKNKGNFSLGNATGDDALELGKAWVGDNHKISKNGKVWISEDGLRQFRLPSYKPKLNLKQANFEWKPNKEMKQWQGNGHLEIIEEGK
jgi:RHS repeat-associated protein